MDKKMIFLDIDGTLLGYDGAIPLWQRRFFAAMAIGDEALKAVASYVTDTVGNDGIVKAFEHYSVI